MSKSRDFLPYGRQDISEDDIQAVVDVLRSPMITQGDNIGKFEDSISRYCGASGSVALASGTAALHTACAALGIKEGSRVWTSPNSFVASANAALYLGAQVDFVDIDITTGNMSVSALEEKLAKAREDNSLPDLLIPVHFAGRPCDMRSISDLCGNYGVRILEDGAHAFGASYDCGRKIGSGVYSDAAIFSFHPVKPITTGEGGVIVSNNSDIIKFSSVFRTHGISRNPDDLVNITDLDGVWYYEQGFLGYHYRMTDIQAALGISQLKRLDDFIVKRRSIAQKYNEILKDLPIELPPESTVSGWHIYVIRLTSPELRLKVFNGLRSAGIGANVHYIPIHLQPYYRNLGFKTGDFPSAEKFYATALTIPIFPSMNEEEQEYVAGKLDYILQ
ncbi:MAG: UDP-4-amino-4,6-dideoxy-N-acetyl-beta-L-altrosamine transaminase [Rickettsiales bacterium]